MDLYQELSKTKQLEYNLLQEIKTTFSKPHMLFYSEREIIEKYELNRTTVRQALKSLTDKGYLYRVNGKGTFTAPKAKLNQILIVQTVRDNPFYIGSYAQIEMNNGISREIQQEDMPYIIIPIDRQYFLSIFDEITLIYKNLSGIVFYSDINPLKEVKQKLENMNIPYLFFGSNLFLTDQIRNFVVYNQEVIVNLALDYLYEKGHRNIGYIYAKNNAVRLQRLDMFKKWMDRKGLPINEDALIDLTYDPDRRKEIKYIEVKEELTRKLPVEGVTAFLCSEDNMAQSFINSAILLGYKIPEDFSVISVNNYPFCQDIITPLTSVSIPFFEGGKEAIEIMDKKINRNLDTGIILPSMVVERNTVKQI